MSDPENPIQEALNTYRSAVLAKDVDSFLSLDQATSKAILKRG